MLRALKRASQDVGGARFTIRFVDPRWDLGAAERLVRRGVATESLAFEKGRRMVALPLADGVSERVCKCYREWVRQWVAGCKQQLREQFEFLDELVAATILII